MQDHCSHLFTKLQPPVVPMMCLNMFKGQMISGMWAKSVVFGTSQGDGTILQAVLQHQKSWKSFGKVGDSRRGAKDAKDGVSWKICSLQIRFIADWMFRKLLHRNLIKSKKRLRMATQSFETRFRWKEPTCSPKKSTSENSNWRALMSNPRRHSKPPNLVPDHPCSC